jgi:hypothetical protein
MTIAADRGDVLAAAVVHRGRRLSTNAEATHAGRPVEIVTGTTALTGVG